MSSITDSRWDARIARARHLAAVHPEAREALDFLAGLTSLQSRLSARHTAADDALADCLDWLASHGPEPMTHTAATMLVSNPSWPKLLDAYASDAADAVSAFAVELLLQAFPQQPCPACRQPSGVSLLREAGHGSRRSNVCNVCLTETPAPRLGCVACGETDVEALPVYRDDAGSLARIDACDTCRTYIKTLDLTRDASACPIADDIASLTLDLWARDQGYTRVRPNLLRL